MSRSNSRGKRSRHFNDSDGAGSGSDAPAEPLSPGQGSDDDGEQEEKEDHHLSSAQSSEPESGSNEGGSDDDDWMAADKEEQDAIDAIQDPIERKKANRKRYRCGEDGFFTEKDIETWTQVAPELQANPKRTTRPAAGVEFSEVDLMKQKTVDSELNDKISIWQGDITRLEIDAIVNAANSSLMGGGGIDGAIHGAAGDLLLVECETLGGAETGETKITKGYKLPARNILHTVGPIGGGDEELESCYTTSLELCLKHNLRTVAFCCVSTGIFGFPLVRATHIALKVIREFLEAHKDKMDRVIFCVFRDIEVESYEKVVPSYFPIEGFPEKELPEGTQVLPPMEPNSDDENWMWDDEDEEDDDEDEEDEETEDGDLAPYPTAARFELLPKGYPSIVGWIQQCFEADSSVARDSTEKFVVGCKEGGCEKEYTLPHGWCSPLDRLVLHIERHDIMTPDVPDWSEIHCTQIIPTDRQLRKYKFR